MESEQWFLKSTVRRLKKRTITLITFLWWSSSSSNSSRVIFGDESMSVSTSKANVNVCSYISLIEIALQIFNINNLKICQIPSKSLLSVIPIGKLTLIWRYQVSPPTQELTNNGHRCCFNAHFKFALHFENGPKWAFLPILEKKSWISLLCHLKQDYSDQICVGSLNLGCGLSFECSL